MVQVHAIYFACRMANFETESILFLPDQRIHLWDFYQDDIKSPSFSLRDLKVLRPKTGDRYSTNVNAFLFFRDRYSA